ncbi:M16 family metallopeptidase [Hyphobacterium marinum]|uniref:Insulinase family protein n=1 Tax=Hyphobacterium marinum TaxID=3116574 RepID=A0ABU7M2B7_9PROT|nr:insulinase family protein [Hyphobacterium sp. Y6023]MEE2567677.1 insulinase family protein [Hyphobacterium sp. Y6023]
MISTLFARTALAALFCLSLAACNAPQRGEAGPDALAETGQVSAADVDFVHEASDLDPDPAVRYGRLENGMRYAILHNETPPNTAAIRMVFNVGSLAEADDQRGLAHFIEHMAFNGSTNVPEGEMVPLLERFGLAFGPDTNAFTGLETVGYQLDLPEVDDETLRTGLFLMRETASELLLDADALDRERGVILGEERVRNTPFRRWNQARNRFLFPDMIIADRDSLLGAQEIIRTAPQERFADFYENFYVPERAIVTVVGDIDVDDVENRIIAQFADWEQPADARPDPELGTLDADRGFDTGYFEDSEIVPIITIDMLDPGPPPADTVANRRENLVRGIADAILNRRLSTLINTGTSPLVQASASSTHAFDRVERSSLLGASTPERWREAVGVLEQELRRAVEFGFTQAELNEQLANIRTSLVNNADGAATRSSTSLADGLWQSWRGDSVFTHPSDSLARFEAYADGITVEEVSAAFREDWTSGEPLVFVTATESLENPEAEIAALWTESQAVAVEPPVEADEAGWAYTDFGTPGEVASRTEVEDLDFTQIAFENGVRLNVKSTDFRAQRVSINIQFGRGDLEPRTEAVVGTVASSVFTSSGLEAHSADDLSRVLAGRAVSANFNVGGDAFTFGSTTTPTDLETQLQLYAAYLTAPGWRPEGLAQFEASIEEFRRISYSSPAGVLSAEGARMIRSGDPRFGFPTREEFAAIDLDDIRAFLTDALEQSPVEITIVGDVSVDDAIAAVAATFGALPERAGEWPDYDDARNVVFPDPTPEPIVLTHRGEPNQAYANVYWPTVDFSDVRRSRALSMLNAVIDLKLTERLREGEGLTYSTANSNLESDIYPGYGYFWIGINIEPQEAERVYDIIDQIVAATADGEISEDEMLRARRPILESIEDAREDNGYWLNVLSGSQEDPERLDNARSLVDDLNSITREELMDLANEYLRDETAYRLTIVSQNWQP